MTRQRLLLVEAGDLDDELHRAERLKATIGAVKSRLRAEGPALAVLGLMIVAGLVLRVLHNDHGLPYVYYVDEGSHFTKRAVEVYRDANPGYFQNPSAYTYLLHLVYRVASIPNGGGEAIIEGYRTNAEWIFEISRGLAAVLCMVGVAAVYYVGSRLWDRRTGLVAAAVLCFAFLPVAFSRLAVTDVGTLAPVALVMLFSVRIVERGGWRWCAAAGAAAGLAIGFKYTAGLVLLTPALAIALTRARHRAARHRDRRARPARRRDRRVLHHQPVLLLRLRHRDAPAARAGRARRQPGQVRPGAGHRAALLPRQPALGARLRRRRLRGRRRRAARAPRRSGSRCC